MVKGTIWGWLQEEMGRSKTLSTKNSTIIDINQVKKLDQTSPREASCKPTHCTQSRSTNGETIVVIETKHA